ncbi:MAG: hypothetical protein QOJ26_13 [Thermoplasmata archaeon]|nr:hypothetical protein [Thermoplasmata archaeon]
MRSLRPTSSSALVGAVLLASLALPLAAADCHIPDPLNCSKKLLNGSFDGGFVTEVGGAIVVVSVQANANTTSGSLADVKAGAGGKLVLSFQRDDDPATGGDADAKVVVEDVPGWTWTDPERAFTFNRSGPPQLVEIPFEVSKGAATGKREFRVGIAMADEGVANPIAVHVAKKDWWDIPSLDPAMTVVAVLGAALVALRRRA